MISSKNRIRSAVTSSFIRRAEQDELIDIQAPSDLPRYAPFDEPKQLQSSIIKKDQADYDMKFISKTGIKILCKLNLMILEHNTITTPVYLDQLALELGHPITTLKKTIQKLEQKGLIKRETFKSGRGGWTIYSIDQKTRDKLDT